MSSAEHGSLTYTSLPDTTYPSNRDWNTRRASASGSAAGPPGAGGKPSREPGQSAAHPARARTAGAGAQRRNGGRPCSQPRAPSSRRTTDNATPTDKGVTSPTANLGSLMETSALMASSAAGQSASAASTRRFRGVPRAKPRMASAQKTIPKGWSHSGVSWNWFMPRQASGRLTARCHGRSAHRRSESNANRLSRRSSRTDQPLVKTRSGFSRL